MSAGHDFVVVGAGSAGCALASRLSEDGRYRVCLLEAGPDDRWNPLIRLPIGLAGLLRSRRFNWAFWSAPQSGLGGRRLFQPRGKTLGGSSSINGTVYVRGHASDYDRWAALGCTGWSWAEVLPFFRKSECHEPGADAFHGGDGPLHIADRRYTNPLSEAFVAAAEQAGYARNPDFNGATQDGVGQYRVFQKDGQRCSNARAYLDPARGRDNLRIVTGAQVTGLLFEGRRVVGLRYRRRGRSVEVRAAREVILSAGAFQSPQLLMLSGIGPPDALQQHGIAVRQALLGVGQNLQDHLDVFVEMRTASRVGLSFHPSAWWRLLKAAFHYLLFRRGELTTNVSEAGGFIRSTADATQPDLQLHCLPIRNAQHGLDLRPVFGGYGYSVMIYALRPHTRGTVTLRDADPLSPPLIDPCYGQDERDLAPLLRGIRRVRAIVRQPALVAHNAEELAPGAALQSDAQLIDYLRRTAEVAYHPAGTCKMGVDDAMAVVDPRLKVYGVEGLRVADCSVMPLLISGNTNAAATMIGEKCAALILDDHAQLPSLPREPHQDSR